ncbi:MAG: methylated-DNA--[protein]-cysteine S-methyltransferase [Thermodesulfovibrionales bacterium]|nr:methylated-DNA--[protein]-cysteine S-methyltransferase [Thermodesulfovibrionales bacterium]
MNSKKLDEHFLFLKEKLDLFFKGRLKHLDIPFKVISGSNFEKKVWFALQEIPYGETKTYKWLAQKIGHPKSYRAVGNALCKNPLPLILPCHRVIGSNGLLRGFSGGVAIKKFLIEHEISYCDYFNLLEFP